MLRNLGSSIKFTAFGALLTWLFLLSIPSTESVAAEVAQSFNGLTLNANLELAPGSTLEDGVVLVLHGILAHNRMEIIQNTQRALAENGHNSLAINFSLGIDNRHGFYDCAWPHRHRQEDAVEEIAAWIDWLKREQASRVVLLAHSRGVNQAMVYAVKRQDPRVTHLIFLAPSTTNIWENYRGRYGADVDDILSRARQLVAGSRGGDLLEGIDFGICPQSDVSANTFLSYYEPDSPFGKFETYLPQLESPTLILTGTLDERSPYVKEKVSPYVDGDLIRMTIIDGAGHFFRDFNIDEAIEAAVEFLDETS